METFKEWLITKVNDNSNIGDLANDVKQDRQFPETNNKQIIYRYLDRVAGCSGVIDAFHAAWNTYAEESNQKLIDEAEGVFLKLDKQTISIIKNYKENNSYKSDSQTIESIIAEWRKR